MKKGLLYIVLTFILSVVNATAGAQSMTNPDRIQISLLTCSPGKEVWAQYGHTAIRYYDKESGEDLAINYGIFSLDQTYFIPSFCSWYDRLSHGSSTYGYVPCSI